MAGRSQTPRDGSGPSPVSVIVGLGRTGVSCARHLASHGHELRITDSRAEPPGLAELERVAPGARLALGGFDAALLDGADQVVVSPGVSLREPFMVDAQARGLDVVGDIELVARGVCGRTVAITGTNGKSTVTTLVGEIAEAAGRDVRVGGNIGRPALDLLAGDPAELYVLELSSFQLERLGAAGLSPRLALITNLSPDHLNWHGSMEAYARAKSQIYWHQPPGGAVALNEWHHVVVGMFGHRLQGPLDPEPDDAGVRKASVRGGDAFPHERRARIGRRRHA